MALLETKETQIQPVQPLMTAEAAVQAWKKFEELKERLLENEDYQTISGKRYIKRSGFRKIAVFFGLSDRIIEEERTNREDKTFFWRIIVEATAPNGRTSIGVGACDSQERKFAHLEHDVYATAHTRAKSRAISDMVAGGVVSAEEMDGAQEPTRPQQRQEYEGPVLLKTEPLQYQITPVEGEESTYVWPPFKDLPWTVGRSQDKREATPTEEAWLFSNTPGAESLTELILEKGAIFMRLEDTKFLCKLSGKDNRFINRSRPDLHIDRG